MDPALLNAVLNGSIKLDFDTLLLIYLIMDSDQVIPAFVSGPLFNLATVTDSFCVENFRFLKTHIYELKTVLGVPEELRCANGTRFKGIEGMCVLLRSLAYPNRLCELKLTFRRPESTLSLICTRMMDFMFDTHSHLLEGLDHWWFDDQHLTTYAAAIHGAGAPLTHCVGFIDGTVRAMCRPSKYQKEVYNGHKGYHGLKFQSVVLPNGLIRTLYGPVSGRRHDCYMLAESGLMPQLAAKMPQHCLYGDPAYPLRIQLQAPYRGNNLTADEQEFNKRMSMHRVTVEWVFGDVISLFAFVDFKKNLKLYLQPIAKFYAVSAILTNCHTCFYGSKTSSRFNLPPPNVNQYING